MGDKIKKNQLEMSMKYNVQIDIKFQKKGKYTYWLKYNKDK